MGFNDLSVALHNTESTNLALQMKGFQAIPSCALSVLHKLLFLGTLPAQLDSEDSEVSLYTSFLL